MTPASPDLRAEALARRFHDAYERLAPSFGYETRKDTRAFDPTTPNGKLMIAVCGELLTPAGGETDALGELARLSEKATTHAAGLRSLSTWMLTHDIDMQCPDDVKDPEATAELLETLRDLLASRPTVPPTPEA